MHLCLCGDFRDNLKVNNDTTVSTSSDEEDIAAPTPCDEEDIAVPRSCNEKDTALSVLNNEDIAMPAPCDKDTDEASDFERENE